ncbi:unnamed protein product [Brassica rapa subsp. narinosa]
MEKSPKIILSTFTNGCSMLKSVKMVSFLLVIFQHQFYVYIPACEAPPDNATELSSRTCSFSGLLELLRSLVYQDFCSTALATSLYALIVHQSA